MKIILKLLAIVVIGIPLCATTGCTTAPKVTTSGFLSDYSVLSKDDPLGFSDRLYVNSNFDHKAYDKFMMDEVVFFISEDAAYKGVPASDLTEISKHFYEAIIREMSTKYTHTDIPGPGVIRFRFAITDLVPTEPISSTVSTIVPVGLVVSAGSRAVAGAHIGMGGASFEAEAHDSESNELLAAAIDAETGKKYKVSKSFTKWGQVKGICDGWAKNLSKRVEILMSREM
jgi:hypothetical protein